MRNNRSSSYTERYLKKIAQQAQGADLSAIGRAGASNMSAVASVLGSTIPTETMLPELTMAQAKNIVQPKVTKTTTKTTSKKSSKATKEKTSESENKDALPDISDISETATSSRGNSGKDKPVAEVEEEKKPSLLEKAVGAVKAFGSMMKQPTAAETSLKATAQRNREALMAQYAKQAENAKAANEGKKLNAKRATTEQLAAKPSLNLREQDEAYDRFNAWLSNKENRAAYNALVTANWDGKANELIASGRYDKKLLKEAEMYRAMYDKVRPAYKLTTRVGGTVAGIGMDMAGGLLGLGSSAVGAIEDATGADLGIAEERKAIDDMLAESERLQARAQAGLSPFQQAAGGVATSALENLAIGAALGPAAVVPLLSLQGAGGQYRENTEKGYSDLENLVSTGANLGYNWALNTKLNPVANSVNSVVKGAVDNALQTGATELADRINEGLIRLNRGERPDEFTLEDAKNMAYQVGLSGVSGGVMGGVNALSGLVRPVAKTPTAPLETLAEPTATPTENPAEIERARIESLDDAFAPPAREAIPDEEIPFEPNNASESQTEYATTPKEYSAYVSPELIEANRDNPDFAHGLFESSRPIIGQMDKQSQVDIMRAAGIYTTAIPDAEFADVVDRISFGATPEEINAQYFDALSLEDKVKSITGKGLRSNAGKSIASLAAKADSMTQEQIMAEAAKIADDVVKWSDFHTLANYKHMYDKKSRNFIVEDVTRKIANAVGVKQLFPNAVGAMTSEYQRGVAPNMDIAEQEGLRLQLTPEAETLYGGSHKLEHDVYSHRQGEYEAKTDVDLAIYEAGGDVTKGIENEMRRLNDIPQWDASNQYSAIEIRNRVAQSLNAAIANGAPTEGIVSRLHAIDDMISEKRSSIGQALQAGQETALTEDNVRQKYSQWKQEQAKRWASLHRKSAVELKNLADKLYGDVKADSPIESIRNRIKEEARKSKLDLTDNQIDKLVTLAQMNAKAEQYYNALLEYAGGCDDLSLEQLQQISELTAKAEELPVNSRERVELEKQIYAVMASTTKGTVLDKVNAWRYLAMLGNTRTHARNIIGNEAMGLLVGVKDVSATLLERVFVKNKSNRRKAILTPADNKLLGACYAYADNMAYRQIIGESRFNVKRGISGETGIFGQNKDIVSKTIGKATEAARKVNSAALEGADYLGVFGELEGVANGNGKMASWAKGVIGHINSLGESGIVGFAGEKAQFARSLAQQIKAKGLTESVLDTESPEVQLMVDRAVNDAREATFHEHSSTSEWLNKAPKPVKTFIEAELPFKQTPINIAKTGARYSPVGLAKTITYDSYRLHSGKISASQYIDNISKGLTGTGIALLGGFLSSIGLVNVPDQEDEKQKFNELQGKQGYSINIGGMTYTIDWLAPSALPFLMGASAYSTISENGLGIGAFADVMASMADPMIESTMLSSLEDTVDSIRYADSGANLFSTLLLGATTNYAGQFVPTALGQMARTVDPIRRSNMAFSEDRSAQQLEYFVNKQTSKIPFLSENNAEYVDSWGRQQRNYEGNMAEGAAYNMLSPGYMAKVNTTKADSVVETIYNELEELGEKPTKVIPSVKASQADVELTEKTYESYAKVKGKTQYGLIEELGDQPYFDSLPATVKADVVSDIYSIAKMEGNLAADKTWKPKSETSAKLLDLYQSEGKGATIDYLSATKAISEAEKAIDNGNLSAVPELLSTLDGIDRGAIDALSTHNRKLYDIANTRGVEALENYMLVEDATSGLNKSKDIAKTIASLDMTNKEKGYCYAMKAGKDDKIRQAYDKYKSGELCYWIMRANQSGYTGSSKASEIKDWANSNVPSAYQEYFIRVMTKPAKEW